MNDQTDTPGRRPAGLKPIDCGLIAVFVGIGIAVLLSDIAAATAVLLAAI